MLATSNQMKSTLYPKSHGVQKSVKTFRQQVESNTFISDEDRVDGIISRQTQPENSTTNMEKRDDLPFLMQVNRVKMANVQPNLDMSPHSQASPTNQNFIPRFKYSNSNVVTTARIKERKDASFSETAGLNPKQE